MIDLETLGTSAKAPIISIGAVFFDKTGTKEEFYAALNVEEQISSQKRFADGSTIKWWMEQENAAKKVFREEYVETQQGLLSFAKWATDHVPLDEIKPWGNGINFDIKLLESIFEDYGMKSLIPWKFRNIRDYRTFKEFVFDGKGIERVGTYHNALDDAITQAHVVIAGMNRNL